MQEELTDLFMIENKKERMILNLRKQLRELELAEKMKKRLRRRASVSRMSDFSLTNKKATKPPPKRTYSF